MRTSGNGHGAYFTPPVLAREHALNAFKIWNWSTSQPDHERSSLLDLGCGDGALINAAINAGVPPDQITGVELNPAAATHARQTGARIIVGDALFTDLPPCDIAIGNPPWVGHVSHAIGADYAKRVAKQFGPGYNAASDLSAAFVIRASDLCDQISFLATNTIMQGRTFRSGVKRLLLSGKWSMIHAFDAGASYTGMGVRPSSHVWPVKGVGVHYVAIHLVRVELERFACFRGGAHWSWT